MASGLVGAAALTTIHELASSRLADAPRMDVLGMRALRRFIPAFAHERPRSTRLRRWALAGDIVANAAYYAAIPGSTRPATWTRAAALGAGAGIGALLLPAPMGLGDPPSANRPRNQVMTVAWYLVGALAAAATANALGATRRQFA